MSLAVAGRALRHDIFSKCNRFGNVCKTTVTASLYTGENAYMTAVYGEKYPYEEPWPYWKKRLNSFTEFLDASVARINGNTKFITVDGNLASGKNEFAKQLARNFDLKYFPAIGDDDLYRVEDNQFNLRDLNVMLPERSQYYDLSMWLREKDKTCGRVGAIQMQFLELRFKQTCMALLHLFSTGILTDYYINRHLVCIYILDSKLCLF